jgi:hypothetical protein
VLCLAIPRRPRARAHPLSRRSFQEQ